MDNHTVEFESYRKVFVANGNRQLRRWMIAVLLVLVVLLCFPWTQNIQAPGIITTRQPELRQQEVNAAIAGRIEQWFVKDGDMVLKGDTILRITEVVENYLDPQLLLRTEEQIEAKEATIDFYRQKVGAIQTQLAALYQTRELKLQQLQNKIRNSALLIETDSMALQAAAVELNIAKEQYKRQEELYRQGLKSLTELEQRKQQMQSAEAKFAMAQNRLENTRNDWLNARMELSATDREYTEKIAKTESEKFSTFSDVTTGEGEVAKLKNQFSNYAIRNAFYYITAPQNGQVVRPARSGVGEVIKQGELLVRIVPVQTELAVEVFVSPVDLPLLAPGNKVRFQFDGWPSIVFSGWPNLSYGTFGGIVVSIDNSISPNGKFRMLVAEDKADVAWPDALRIGGGAKAMALLSDVPLGYELWRRLNGFPPDFYIQNESSTAK